MGWRLFPKSLIRNRWPLDLPLCAFSSRDPFTLADACEGVAVFGMTGSGKTTGSGEYMASGFLAVGMGGLVLTAKPDERAQWERYCRKHGRLQDLVVMSAGGDVTFNFMNYELRRPGRGGGLTENLANLFTEVLGVMERRKGGGREDEGYWQRACQQLVRNALDILMLGRGDVSLPELYRTVISLPQSIDAAKSPSWKESSFAFSCLKAADAAQLPFSRRQDLALAADYALLEFPAISDRTRSVIVSTFTSLIDVLQRGVLRELFCSATTITPEMIADGKILLIDLPVKEYLEVGRLAQIIFKYVFMRAIEHRPPEPDMRPVFLWADESQNFVSEYDFQFQTTARSARVCTVYLTQNISNLYATMGAGDEGKARVDSLLGNLNTKIMHANGDSVTNAWAAELIGQSRQFHINASHSQPLDPFSALCGLSGGNASAGGGVNEVLEHEVPPSTFTTLRKGGVANKGEIDAIVYQAGRRFRANGATWMPVTFQQRF